MTTAKLLTGLLKVQSSGEAKALVQKFMQANPSAKWAPVGGRENNRGTIEVSSNPGRALVERVTNAIDAVLDAEHVRHGGKPACTSPREAAQSWLNVPSDGLSAMTTNQRRQLATESVHVRLAHGDDKAHCRVQVTDFGIGLTAAEMPKTILSLNESNKVHKPHLAGTYGQGGSATFASSELSLIASRRQGSSTIAFTVVRFEPPPPNAIKGGSYVYLTVDGAVAEVVGVQDLLKPGTTCLHFCYDLTKLTSPLGPNSVYGLLQEVMFDPVLPLWFDDEVHNYRRVIKGSRNALNGAVDEGDEVESQKLAHSMPMFYVNLGDYGRAGIEYWLLNRPKKDKKRPTAGYVDPQKPIVLTLNGQNQHEMTLRVIKKDAELPFLAQRLICHIDCNNLTAPALRSLFTSGREEARRGAVLALLENELVQALKSDDELARLNAEARDQKDRAGDNQATNVMRKEVAKLLQIQGFEVEDTGAVTSADGDEPPRPPRFPRPPRPKPTPIPPAEPPTYIKIVWPDDEPIAMYPEQRRYVRVETDANSTHHDAKDPTKSHINVVVNGLGMLAQGTTPLAGGRMRVVVTCSADAKLGDAGTLQVELRVPGRTTLSDSRPLAVESAPLSRPGRQKLVMPPFDVRPVHPDDEQWNDLGWPDNCATVASEATSEGGLLTVYYSTAFPRYAEYLKKLTARSDSLAASYDSRYRIWLAVHSLILNKERQGELSSRSEHQSSDDEQASELERAERCRVATMAAMFAAAEVEKEQQRGVGDPDD